MLLDTAISRYVIKKEAQMILNYKGLTIEIQRVWNVKTKVIVGATGTMLKSFRKYQKLRGSNGKYEYIVNTNLLGNLSCKITFLMRKENSARLFHVVTLKVGAFIATCYQGVYALSTEFRTL